MSETRMMIEKCELTSWVAKTLHKRDDSMRGSRKTVVPTLSSTLVFRSRPSPRQEARHA